jgi:two-component system, chemotaxis family, CheB/CheR fusion protein
MTTQKEEIKLHKTDKIVPKSTSAIGQFNEDSLKEIFSLLLTKTEHDFSKYKKNTINRRIEKRMILLQIDNVKDYVDLLNRNAAEVDILFKEFLVSVTGFFRDSAPYKVLKEKVIPDLIKNKKTDEPLRIWVPGCATG